jgi:hypothetical protein
MYKVIALPACIWCNWCNLRLQISKTFCQTCRIHPKSYSYNKLKCFQNTTQTITNHQKKCRKKKKKGEKILTARLLLASRLGLMEKEWRELLSVITIAACFAKQKTKISLCLHINVTKEKTLTNINPILLKKLKIFWNKWHAKFEHPKSYKVEL